MQYKKLLIALTSVLSLSILSSCTKESSSNSTPANKNIITVDIGSDPATVDPQMSEDTQSHRVANDLFEGLTTTDQSNHVTPGLAKSWDISADGKTYTFHLRDGIKFSDGTHITANDVVFTYQRLVDPKVSSPYNILISNIINAKDVMKSTKPVTALGIKAINPTTVEIQLVNPDASFLSIVSLWNLGIVSQTNITKFGAQWIDPKNMVTSGPYKLTERIVKGHLLENKNPNYYDAANVAIEQVKLVPVEDNNSALSQYKSGDLDITYSLPIDQYKKVKDTLGKEEHTTSLEGMYYYDLNMTSAKFKNNPKLRQALSMAVDRETLTKDVLGQDQVPLYSYATSTIDGGKYAGLDYSWSKLPHVEQVKQAQQLFKEAGYSDANPLKITISYNTNDLHKKVTLAIASMWQQAFGAKSIIVDSNNQEWKTFLQTRHKGDYDVARDAWIADYDSIDSYTNLYECDNPQNNSHSCNPEFDKLIDEAKATQDDSKRVALIRQALQIAQNDYAVIPLYQYTYFRLIKPTVTGYTPDTNHLDHVSSKWYKYN